MARWLSTLSICCLLAGQNARNVIVLTGRTGVIEFIDPSTLTTQGRIQIDLPPGSAGLNGAAASAGGHRLYVEGPLGADPHGCCWLYSIDLDTLQSKVEAGIGGSGSRNSIVISNGIAHLLSIGGLNNDRLFVSPDASTIFGVRSFRGPAVDIYDIQRGSPIRELRADLEGNWAACGTWSSGRFYFYASNTRDGSSKLWTVSAATIELGSGVAVASFGEVAGCSDPYTRSIIGARDKLFLYDEFGFKNNRCFYRNPGGAWMIDPASGHLLRQVASGLHFSTLLAAPDGTALYGLVPGGPDWQAPVRLVRIDARDGQVTNSRVLDTDFWRMAIAPVQVRSGIVNLIPSDDPATPLRYQR